MNAPLEFSKAQSYHPVQHSEVQTPLTLEGKIEEYCSTEKHLLMEFIEHRKIEFQENISQAEYDNAIDIGKGVSGAKKITLDGKEFLIKSQIFTDLYKDNFKSAIEKGTIAHKLVSESDDSFAHFPRKEVLGYHLAKAFGIEHIPHTRLVAIGDNIASMHNYIPENQAVCLINQKINESSIENESKYKTLFFHFVTENIDGHAGNILLYMLPADSSSDSDDDNVSPLYKAIPIDFGLIFPRHNSVYPAENSFVKKAFFNMTSHKSIRPLRIFEKINIDPELVKNNPEIRALLTDNEKNILQRNLLALRNVCNQCGDESIKIYELFDKFVAEVTMLKGCK